eukprot:CAMPEP_0174919248 /NCGR_PEP_ID=MMETSP1355-20121228/3559_1 /TAXON_ID=464990 /ORGANISM="Hemiselmis tepida, Strain CCMP443" /LENGTH=544 /DNA_ID=CAMNT_0016164465 /DNA_START=68 /DNA_END=1699 /DNA_ORIENTATION=-
MSGAEVATLGLATRAFASLSPQLLVAASTAVSLFSWLQLAKVTIPAAVASLAILATIPFHLSAFYYHLTKDNFFDLDSYVAKGIEGHPNKKLSFKDRIKVAALNELSVGRKVGRSSEAHPLTSGKSPFIEGLDVSSLRGPSDPPLPAPEIVVGTIRMGFGHHRIAYSACSWGLQGQHKVLFHDLLNIKSPEADLIRETDKKYSLASRIATEMGSFFERIWGSITKSGDANMLRGTSLMAENIKPLLNGLPKDTPIIATHSLVGLTAVACGFTNVINLVIDNYPQWFVIVPGAVNLVQGPINHRAFLRWGVPESEVRLAGHWCPADLVENIDADCKARKARRAARKPVRLLVPVGGAGAQRKFVTRFLEALEGPIKAGEVQVMLNAGDHKHMRESFAASLAKMGLSKSDYEVINTMQGVTRFAERLRGGAEPPRAVTLFAFQDYFPAVAATDVLSRVADVLACKPSELAFYPVPKLMLRRVGDHEAASAVRAAELGDGTTEVREVEDAVAWVKLFSLSGTVLEHMNDRIMINGRDGVYDGCKTAV